MRLHAAGFFRYARIRANTLGLRAEKWTQARPRGLAVALLPLAGAILYCFLLLGFARMLPALSDSGPVVQLVAAAPGDDVHAQLALDMAGDISPGSVVLGPDSGSLIATHLGDELLRSTFPAFLGIVFSSGSSLVGLHILLLAVHLTLVFLGAVLLGVVHAFPGSPIPRISAWPHYEHVASFGVVLLGTGAGANLFLSWQAGTGGEMILGMIATKVFEIDGATYASLHPAAGLLLSFVLDVVLVSLALVGGLLCGWTALFTGGREVRRLPSASGLARRALVLTALTVLLFHTPIRPAIAIERAAGPSDDELALSLPYDPAVALPKVPSQASIQPVGTDYVYEVNRSRQEVRCIGYNPITGGETATARAARYDRDFALLQRANVNTILGWDQRLFDDDQLFSLAAKHGLGVIPHFHLEAALDYDDPMVFASISKSAVDWVRRHKSKPSLRMWGVGNEVIHVFAPQQAEIDYRRTGAFTAFLVKLADVIHAEDPHHPVLYRDAEDVFVPFIVEALRADRVHRPWFVYGMNFYTYRLDSALREGPARTAGLPLLVSEFAPLGLAPFDRPIGYLKLWAIVRRYSDRVLGGCAYVWTTAGPEPVDRMLGLTDASGKPVDDSLAGLAAAFGRGAPDSRASIAGRRGIQLSQAGGIAR